MKKKVVITVTVLRRNKYLFFNLIYLFFVWEKLFGLNREEDEKLSWSVLLNMNQWCEDKWKKRHVARFETSVAL